MKEFLRFLPELKLVEINLAGIILFLLLLVYDNLWSDRLIKQGVGGK